ncbi:MAG: hypothetical protein ACREFI_06525 [Stellaceae bacterium]
MNTRSRAHKRAVFQAGDEAGADAELERYLRDHHDDIEAKLKQARDSIARGEAKDLEPLTVLLRHARQRTKTFR